MLRKGDLVLALDHKLWASLDIAKKACYRKAVIINVHHCEYVPLDEPYRVLVDLFFEDNQQLARSYFADHLIKLC